ncbi:hypothetical protein HYU06_07395 [Candidatus Woesearchaeota archaeon]|nr:hypothetical protein [Candidatus Woesearchaeota archaeon]
MSTLEHTVKHTEVNAISSLPNPYGFIRAYGKRWMISMARAGDTKLDPTPYAKSGKMEEFKPREEFYRDAA